MKFGIREVLFLVVMAGLLACSYFLVLKKADEKRLALEAQIGARQKALADLDRATAGIADVGHKVEELQQAITFFESKLPQEREIDKVLKEVWQMAEANALTTKTIKTAKAQRSASYSEQPIEMSLSGNFDGFYSYLLQLERLPRLTRVSTMMLEKISGRDGEMEAKLTLSVFFEPDTAATASAR
jgi:type IV pilus assembly protein PilO